MVEKSLSLDFKLLTLLTLTPPDKTNHMPPLREQIKKISPLASLPPQSQKSGKDNKSTPAKPPKKSRKKTKAVALSFLLSLFLLLIFLILPLIKIKNSATALLVRIEQLRESSKTRDLQLLSREISSTKESASKLNHDLARLFWVKPIPFIGNYIKDANSASKASIYGLEAAEIIIKAIEPYSDIIGLRGDKSKTDGAQTAQDRITFIVETIDKIAPQLDPIAEKLKTASDELDRINPNRYPQEWKGQKIRENLVQIKALSAQAAQLTNDAKPLLEAAPYILGVKEKRTYLVIFQNDAELRPTGGFMTAYAILELHKGKAKPIFSDDIYELDKKYTPSLEAPKVLIKYISYPYQNDPRWRLRDMNLSPDFKSSMETFLPEYEKTRSPKVDGVIAVDTQLLVKLLGVIGKIGVPGYGNFGPEDDPRCNCPQVIYELENIADSVGPIVWDPVSGKIVYRPPFSEDRKGVIGPLMNSILANAVGQPKEKLPVLVQVALEAVQQKHLLLYFTDPKAQLAAESFNLAGRVRESAGDYLYIVSSNFAGAKSNMYVNTEVSDVVTVQSDGSTEHQLVIDFNNPQKHDGWLNGINRNWFRIYVPKGSSLIDSSGSEVKVDSYEDLGKTVFSGFLTVRPAGGVARFTIKYKTPPLPQNHKYLLLVQKQPGSKNDAYAININGKDFDFPLLQDKQIDPHIR